MIDVTTVRAACVVDDDPVVLELLVETLSNAGFRVWQARGMEEALRAAWAVPHPDVVVSDIHLGEDSGIELALRLKAGIRRPR